MTTAPPWADRVARGDAASAFVFLPSSAAAASVFPALAFLPAPLPAASAAGAAFPAFLAFFFGEPSPACGRGRRAVRRHCLAFLRDLDRNLAVTAAMLCQNDSCRPGLASAAGSSFLALLMSYFANLTFLAFFGEPSPAASASMAAAIRPAIRVRSHCRLEIEAPEC